jgi:hypothetical protein
LKAFAWGRSKNGSVLMVTINRPIARIANIAKIAEI